MTAKQHSPGFVALVNEARKAIHEIDIDTFRRMRESGEKFLLIDVREDNEFHTAHAAGAMHLSKGIIERDIEERVPDPDARLVLYCGGGYRSALAAQSLQKMGYRNILSLDGGWRSYEASGLPVEMGPRT